MDWISLIIAGCFEIIGIVMMNRYKKKKNFIGILFIVLAFVMSFSFLSYAMKTLPMGLSYAIWTAIGGAGGAILGMVLYNESKDLKRIAFISIIILSVLGLKLSA